MAFMILPRFQPATRTGLKYFSKPPSANNADEIAASVVHPAQTKVSRVRLLRRRSVHAQPLS
jgi:hypothetical protein